jgi:hypothetical protein
VDELVVGFTTTVAGSAVAPGEDLETDGSPALLREVEDYGGASGDVDDGVAGALGGAMRSTIDDFDDHVNANP